MRKKCDIDCSSDTILVENKCFVFLINKKIIKSN